MREVQYLSTFAGKDDMEKIAADAPVARFPFAKSEPDLSDIFKLATEENWKSFLGIA